jgi:hypothetical protein
MTEEQINSAIAEHCGWTVWADVIGHMEPDGNGEPKFVPIGELPDYCNDLNAMHEAEKTLNGGKINTYLGYLYESNQVGTPTSNLNTWEMVATRRSTHATSRKRAEAFLKTIDKWEES